MSQPTIAVCAVQGAFIEHEQRLAALGCSVFELRQASDLKRPFDALVLPGGESTVQAKLLRELGMFDTLRARIADGLPVLGTCAGLILLAARIDDAAGDLAGLDPQIASVRTAVCGFGTLPATVRRNGYGRQLGSFRAYAPFGESASGGAANPPLRTADDSPSDINSARSIAPESVAAASNTLTSTDADAAKAETPRTPVIPMTFIRAPFITEVGDGPESARVLARVDERIVAVQAQNQIGVAFHPELDEDNTVYRRFLSLV